MSCSVCGQNTCCCGPTNGGCMPQDTLAFGNSPGCKDCCQSVVPGSPTPFYQACSQVQENHTQVIINQNFSAGLTIQDTWNIPDCNEFATVTVPGLTAINVGSYLFSGSFGYFQIDSFNSTLGQLTLLNTCVDGNAAPGTQVPSCTVFTVTSSPCQCSNNNSDVQPFVAIDFTAPNAGDCTNITVTTLNTLVVGKNIEISSGLYVLNSIVSGNVIRICNEGQGLTPGTPIIAKDGAGNYQYPVVVVDVNPCSSDAQPNGAVLVCNTGTQAPLSGIFASDTSAGYVVAASLVNAATNEAEYIPINAPELSCTTLSLILTITAAVSTYTLHVVDNSFISIGDILTVEGSGLRFTVTGTGSGTVAVTTTTVPASPETHAIGNSVCELNCCEFITQHLIPPLQGGASVMDQKNQSDSFSPFTLNHTTPSYSGTHNNFTITNPSATKTLNVMLIFTSSIPGTLTEDVLSGLQIFLNFKLNGGATQSPNVVRNFCCGGAAQTLSMEVTGITQPLVIAPGASATVEFWASIGYIRYGTDNSTFVFTNSFAAAAYLGVAL